MANNPATATHKNCRPARCATTLSSEDEEQIAQWVWDVRSEGIPVSKFLLQCKALEVAKDLGLTDTQFKARPSWISGFIKRWKLAMRAKTRSGQSNLEQGEAALAVFSNRIRQLVQTEAIDDIYNADQTGINFEYIPKHTIDRCGAKTVWIRCSGHEKDRMTAMLLADNKGTKYPLFLVLKSGASKVKATVIENLTKRNGFGPVVWPEVEELHERHASRLYGNPTAWWNGHISKEFLKYHFGYRKDKNMKKILLLWDDFSAHFSDDVVACAESLDVLLEKIPPTFTWICQPADVAWMKPLKASMRVRWVTYLRHEIQNQDRSSGTFKLRPLSRDNLVEWVNEAWEAMPKSTIVRGFVKCNLINGAEVPVHEETASPTSAAEEESAAILMSMLRQMPNGDDFIQELDDTSDILDESVNFDGSNQSTE
ncbi:hypothetical protein DYB25_012669 [Aphanomyces astaci]|uniref:HTH CENPB-type domain-containing protein n=1 Tax=Aphanomyces astaci TaxID=112090 RepID=A0A397C763_APHAT|nr:hypothetical protein DYB25_012669 [Aphanomyces astaci]RHY40877.1 hypothetical protein DYB38_013391 [Aphanomyces astaci]RHY84071.1 hypothetical protein DYB26_001654 [Aphanomyces astaci]